MVYFLHYIPYDYEEIEENAPYENYHHKTLTRFTKRTKGHSILPQRSYGLSPRSSRYNADEDYPVYRPPTSTFHTGADYFVADAMASHATAIGSNTVYDNYDLATKSRGKDKRLMSQVNAALPPEEVSKGSTSRFSMSRAANRRLLQKHFPESHDSYSRSDLLMSGSLPEYRKPTKSPKYKLTKLDLDEPIGKIAGGSLRSWLADGLSKTRNMFRKDDEGSSEFRWLDAPPLDLSASCTSYNDRYGSPFSDRSLSPEPTSSQENDRHSPDKWTYEYSEPDLDLDDGTQHYISQPPRRRSRELPSVRHLRRMRRRRHRNRTPPFRTLSSLTPLASDTSSEYSYDADDTESLDSHPISVDRRNRYTQYMPYEPSPPYPTTQIFSDYGTSLPKLPSMAAAPYSSPASHLPELRTRPSISASILFNTIVSGARRRALANLPGPSFDFDTSNITFSIDSPLSYRPKIHTPPRLEWEEPVSYQPLSPRIRITPVSDTYEPYRPMIPFELKTNRNVIDLSKPVVVELEAGDDFFSKFLAQRKQFRDTILSRLDDGVGPRNKSLIPWASSRYYDTSPVRTAKGRRSPEPDGPSRNRSLIPWTSSARRYDTSPIRAIVTRRRSPEPVHSRYERKKRDTDDDSLYSSRSSRSSYPVRTIVSVSSAHDPHPRYSTHDRIRPAENDDDSMSLVPVSKSNPPRTYSCDRDTDEGAGKLTTLERIRMKAYASPSTPARARASRRANRERAPVQATSAYQTQCTAPTSVPYQVPILPLYPTPESRENMPLYRNRSVSPPPSFMYWRPVGGRARVRTSRRDLGVVRAESMAPLDWDIKRSVSPRARSVSPVSWCYPREAELSLSPSRFPSRANDPVDYPYTRGCYLWYPRAGRRLRTRAAFPRRRLGWGTYPYVGSRWGGYPFGSTNWIVSPGTATALGVLPVRAGRWEDADPVPASRWWTDSPRDITPAYSSKWDALASYDPHWDITPAEAVRFGIEPSVAAKWNAASPIRTGRWDPLPSEASTWESPFDDTFARILRSRREGSPPRRSVSPLRGDVSALSPSEAARWGIRPDEAVAWGFYPASRALSPRRFERSRSLSPIRYDWGLLTPSEEARWGLSPQFRSRSLSPSAGRNWFVSPLEEATWNPYPMKPRDLSPLRFVPLPLRSYARTYVPPRMGKKAIAPSKAARRTAARRRGYYPRPSVYLAPESSSYFDQKMAGKKAKAPYVSERERKSRPRPGYVALVREMFTPRKPFEAQYSGQMETARALARAMTVIPQEMPQYIVYPAGKHAKAAIISPNVEIETKRKKEPKSKYAAAVMREMRLNPKEASSYEVPYVSDRFDRFNIRKPKTTSPGIYGTGLIASKPVPKPSGARTIRQNEGYSRPKNLLSWQYRLDAYMNPKDIFYTPASVYRMKEQLRDVHEKLDRHRQMLDRYIDVDLGPGDDVSARIARRHADIEAREKSVIEEYKCDIRVPKVLVPKEPVFRIYIPKSSDGESGQKGGGQTSALRQRLRKVVCKTRNDPTYYKE